MRSVSDESPAASPMRAVSLADDGDLHPQLLKGEHSNTAIVYGDRLFLKIFRRLQPGVWIRSLVIIPRH